MARKKLLKIKDIAYIGILCILINRRVCINTYTDNTKLVTIILKWVSLNKGMIHGIIYKYH